MAKLTLNRITNLQNEQRVINAINANNAAVEAAIENTLSRDGTAPNAMNTNLDMNSNRIYNLPAAVAATEPLRKAEAQGILDLAGGFQLAIDSTQDAVVAYTSIQALYLGEKTTLPTVDNLGQPLQNGVLVSLVGQVNPDDDGLYTYTSGSWDAVGVLPSAFERVYNVLATAGQTVVTVPEGYSVGTTKVYRNGVLQRIGTNLGTGVADDDVTASNGTTLIFPPAVLAANDLITVITSKAFGISTTTAADILNVPAGTVSSTNVQAALNELDTEKVPTTRVLSATGLMTGGATLAADISFNVPKSTNAQAIAGVDDTTAMTPIRVKEAITAAGGSPASTLITSGTTGSIAQLDLQFTGGYDVYELVYTDFEPVTASQNLLIRYAYDATPTFLTGTGYYQAGSYTTSADSIFHSWSAVGANSFVVTRLQAAAAGFPSLGTIRFGMGDGGRYSTISMDTTYATGAGNVENIRAGGHNLATVGRPTWFRLIYNSGNIAAGGKYKLYGLRS